MASGLIPDQEPPGRPGRAGAVADGVTRRAQGPQALLRLEWPAVLERISALASSDAGAEHVRNLVPETARDAAEAGLRLADEMVGLLLKVDWIPPPIPDVQSALKRLAVEGSVLDATELDGVARLLSSSRLCRADLRRFPDELPGLTAIGGRMLKSESLERRLLNAFDAAGGIADSASQDLRRIRRALRSSRSSIVRRLETFARSLPDRIQVPDGSVTIRSGRYCIPVRREGMSEVGGIVHDESATHRTVFVEPPQVIQPMNRLAELEREEQREIARILRQLTAAARPRSAELTESLEALAVAAALREFDPGVLTALQQTEILEAHGSPKAREGRRLVQKLHQRADLRRAGAHRRKTLAVAAHDVRSQTWYAKVHQGLVGLVCRQVHFLTVGTGVTPAAVLVQHRLDKQWIAERQGTVRAGRDFRRGPA